MSDVAPTTFGRDPKTGQFARGNRASPGNPHIAKVAALKAAIMKTVGPEQMVGVFENLLELAHGAKNDCDKIAASRVIIEYAVGKPPSADVSVELSEGAGITFVIKREGSP